MFSLLIKIFIVLMIALVILFLIWLIAFLIHIARDEIAIENRQNFTPNVLDVIVNNIVGVGFHIIEKIYQLFGRS